MLSLGLNMATGSVMQSSALLLDTYGGAAAAYSLRKLRSGYTGKVVQVRRSGTNTEVAVSFDANGGISLDSTIINTVEETTGSSTNLTTSAANLGEFVNSALYYDADGLGYTPEAFVVKWYDQSGNTNDATQLTAGKQPKIVASGAVIVENGKPILRKGTANASMRSAYDITTGGDRTVIMNHTRPVNSFASNATNWIGNGGADNFFASAENQPEYAILGNVTINSAHKNGSSWSYPTIRQDLWTDINGQNLYFIDADFSFGTTGFCLGYQDGAYNYAMMDTQEIIIYTSDQSANRTGIETNINTFYSIY